MFWLKLHINIFNSFLILPTICRLQRSSDCHWSPDKIDIYKPRRHIDVIPEVGSLWDHFEKINSFKFSGETLSLHTDASCLSTLSVNYLKSLNLDSNSVSKNQTTFYESLMLSLIEENLWISTFIKPAWSSFNRSARLTTAILSMSLMSLGKGIEKRKHKLYTFVEQTHSLSMVFLQLIPYKSQYDVVRTRDQNELH